MNRSVALGKFNKQALLAAGLFCLILCVAGLIFLADRPGSASAAPGGIGIQAKPAKKKALSARFGNRVLREGMTGPDVRVLKSIVRAKKLLRGSGVTQTFDRPTTSAVRRFQNKASISRSGVVNRRTAKAMVRSLGTSVSTWYGPGFFGNKTACGKTLRPRTIGVAHKTLPCGTKVLIGYRGKFMVMPVIDRGPYGAGRTWDVTIAVSNAIGMTSAGVAKVRHAVVRRAR